MRRDEEIVSSRTESQINIWTIWKNIVNVAIVEHNCFVFSFVLFKRGTRDAANLHKLEEEIFPLIYDSIY